MSPGDEPQTEKPRTEVPPTCSTPGTPVDSIVFLSTVRPDFWDGF